MRQFPFRVPTREFIWREGGQTVVLVALLFAMLMGFAAMSVDIGRFYAERRFLQNAVDSAALACAVKYATSGQDAAAAWAAGDNVLQQRNLLHNPLGLAVTYAARGGETYDNGIVQPTNLNSGILPTIVSSPPKPGLGCRVAITVNVPTYLLKIVSPTLDTIGVTTRGYAKAKSGLLPSVVNRYINPGDTDNIAGNDGNNEFVDVTAAAGFGSACSAGSNYLPGCTPASMTAPGPIVDLFGQAAKAANDSSFRGYIGLDVRNFSVANPPGSANLIHDSYNGVAPDATVNTLKAFESAWINQGYPGPDICVVSGANFLPCAQISVLDGSSSGIFVTNYQQFFNPGDVVMLQLYDGTVKTVPDFTIVPPGLTVPVNGPVNASTVKYSMSPQFSTSGSTICTDLVKDDGSYTGGLGDQTGKNPFNTGALATSTAGSCTGLGTGNLAADPVPSGQTSYSQTWSGMVATGAQQGIYQAFLRGQASAPYSSRVHVFPVKVIVGGQTTEYDLSPSTTYTNTAFPPPPTASLPIVVSNGNGSTQWHIGGAVADGPITVSWESCPKSTDLVPVVLPCYIGAVGTTSTTVLANTTVNVTVNTSGGTDQTTYYGWIRTVGNDNTGHPVVKLLQIQVDVDQHGGGTTNYIDVLGYAAFKLTTVTSNDVYGYAVSGAYLDPNDPNLAIGKKLVLVPWETP